MSAESQYWDGKQLAVYLVAFVLAIGPFFNGMFFEPIRLVGVALACVAYWLWYTGKRANNLAWNGIDWSILAWFLSYVLASINPVLPRGHLSVMLDMVAFLAVYTVMRGSPQLEQALTHILVPSGLVMVAISVARFAGVFWLDRFVVDLVIDGRLSGGFQYPNTFAVWICCLVLLALRQALTERSKVRFLLIGGLLAGAFMLTLSRGALIAAPAAYLVMMMLGAKQDRLFTAWVGLLTWGPAFLLGSAALRAFQQGHRVAGLAALAACALPPLAAPYFSKFTHFLWSRRRSWGIATAGVLLLAALLVAPKLAGKMRPVLDEMSQNRMTSGYGLADLNVFSRLLFDRDALRIMSAHYFLGAGGRAWTKLYLQFRTYPYFTSEVHNHFLQTGVEAGLIGLLAFSGMLAFCLITAWRFREQANEDNSVAVWAAVVTYIGIHCAFDFDLSYLSLLLLLAVAAGIISSRTVSAPETNLRWLPLWRRSLVAVTVLGLIAAGSLYVADRAMIASDQAWANGDVPGTISKLQLAHHTDPLRAEPWLRMAALNAVPGRAHLDLPDTKSLLNKAQTLDAFDPGTILQLAGIAFMEKRWSEGVDLALKADFLIPLDQDVNAAVASMMWDAVSDAVQAGDTSAARAVAARMKNYEGELNRRFKQSTPYVDNARVPYGYNGIIHLRLGQGLIVAGDYAAAVHHLVEAANWQSERAEATQWRFVALNLGGRKQEAELIRQDNPESYAQFMQSDLYRKLIGTVEKS